MEKSEIVKDIIISSNGIAKSSQFIERGLTNYDIKNLHEKGYIEKVRHGVYALANMSGVSEEVLIQTILNDVVVCLESALFYYGYSDFTPRKWSITVSRTMSVKKIHSIGIPFNIFYVSPDKLNLGKTTADFNGTKLNIYDRDKTICDCFKYQNKIDSELFYKAINAYISDDNKNLVNLAKYAKEMRVYKKMMTIIGVMLNG